MVAVLSAVVVMLAIVSWNLLTIRELGSCTLPEGDRIHVYFVYHPNPLMALSGVGGLQYRWISRTKRGEMTSLTSCGAFDYIGDVRLRLEPTSNRAVRVITRRTEWLVRCDVVEGAGANEIKSE